MKLGHACLLLPAGRVLLCCLQPYCLLHLTPFSRQQQEPTQQTQQQPHADSNVQYASIDEETDDTVNGVQAIGNDGSSLHKASAAHAPAGLASKLWGTSSAAASVLAAAAVSAGGAVGGGAVAVGGGARNVTQGALGAVTTAARTVAQPVLGAVAEVLPLGGSASQQGIARQTLPVCVATPWVYG